MKKTIRKPVHAANKPKGSFPSVDDRIVLAKPFSGKKKPLGKSVTKSVLKKMMNVTVRIAQARVASLGQKTISFEQSLSRDSTIREEEIFLMDYVDGTFEV